MKAPRCRIARWRSRAAAPLVAGAKPLAVVRASARIADLRPAIVVVQQARRARAPALCDYSLGPTAMLLARDRGSVDLQSMTRARARESWSSH